MNGIRMTRIWILRHQLFGQPLGIKSAQQGQRACPCWVTCLPHLGTLLAHIRACSLWFSSKRVDKQTSRQGCLLTSDQFQNVEHSLVYSSTCLLVNLSTCQSLHRNLSRDNIAVVCRSFQIQESETNGVERQYFWNLYPYLSVFLSLNEKKLPIDFECIIKRYTFAG